VRREKDGVSTMKENEEKEEGKRECEKENDRDGRERVTGREKMEREK
jgi:hypothetical protein